MCTFVNSNEAGADGCEMCGSALPLPPLEETGGDGGVSGEQEGEQKTEENSVSRGEGEGSSSQAPRPQRGGSVADGGTDSEETEDAAYLRSLAEAQRESAKLARDLDRRQGEFEDDIQRALGQSMQRPGRDLRFVGES